MARLATELQCAAKAVATNALRDGVVQYMPGGVHTITPSQNGRPVIVTVKVTQDSAKKLEAQRRILTAEGRKPFFSVDHSTNVAAFWPTKFFWGTRLDAVGKMSEGVWAEGKATDAGLEAADGQNFRTFSPTFFVDDVKAAQAEIICNDGAKANMGALVNDPAFDKISPLWAGRAGTNDAGRAGASGNNQQHRENNNMDKTPEELLAELQARNEELEHTIAGLSAKNDQVSLAEVRAARAEQKQIASEMKEAKANQRIAMLEASNTERADQDADAAVARMVKAGKIPPRALEAQRHWKTRFTNDPSLIPDIAPVEASSAAPAPVVSAARQSFAPGTAVARQTAPHQAAIDASQDYLSPMLDLDLGSGWSMGNAMREYMKLVCANANTDWQDPARRTDNYIKKGRLALDAGVFFKTVLEPNLQKWEHADMREIGRRIGLQASNGRIIVGEIQAADFSSDNTPSNVLGVLSGTLVLQRTLPKFAYKYPELMAMTTDFSDTPGLYNQTETTRIVAQPATQKFDTTTDGTGRPKGWSTVSPAQTTDVSLTLTDHIGVPMVFGQNQLSATNRRLFDEQSELAIKAIAAYFTNMAMVLMTKGGYNAYATANTTTVPTAYITYVKGLGEWSMGDLDTLDAVFTQNKVPEEERFMLLNTAYYAKLRGDPRLSFIYAASGKDTAGQSSQFLSEAKLPKLSGFAPYKAPYLPQSTPATAPTTNNIVGFAGQKAAMILKSRLPQDFTQALGVMVPGSVTTITDPDTKISIMLVQYVALQGGWAEWRPEVILGAAVGDNRAGLVITSAAT